MNEKNNIAIGFLLIYLRDFAANKEEWINSYSIGKRLEGRLAHVHENLFAFLNILIGYLLIHFKEKLKNAQTISWLTLTGLLMPIEILTELLGLTYCIGVSWSNCHDRFGNMVRIFVY